MLGALVLLVSVTLGRVLLAHYDVSLDKYPISPIDGFFLFTEKNIYPVCGSLLLILMACMIFFVSVLIFFSKILVNTLMFGL